jgi:DNA mismatch endonuclease (patch repair protein)
MDSLTPERRSWLMSRVRQRDTGPEREVRRLIRSLGLRYRLNVTSLPGKPDIVFHGKRKAILVHGCFWHRHRGCRYATRPKSRLDYWDRKFERNTARDRRVLAELRKAGWQTLVIWTCQLQSSTRVMQRIVKFLADDNNWRGRTTSNS